MADKTIWNDEKTMNFLANMYLASYIYRHKYTSYDRSRQEYRDKVEFKIRVQLKGVTLNTPSKWPGLLYASYESEEEAKKGLAQLNEELVRLGVIEEPASASDNRFEHVEI